MSRILKRKRSSLASASGRKRKSGKKSSSANANKSGSKKTLPSGLITNGDGDLFDLNDFEEREKERMIPLDQLNLTETELKEEFTKTLTSIDANKPDSLTQFNFKTGEFNSRSMGTHLKVHFDLHGIIDHKSTNHNVATSLAATITGNGGGNSNEREDDDEGGENGGGEKEDDKKNKNEESENGESKSNEDDENQSDDKKSDENGNGGDSSSSKKANKKLVKNEFNYSERASQTLNQPMRERGLQTEPPHTSTFSQNASAAVIFDEYAMNLKRMKGSGNGGGGGGSGGSSSSAMDKRGGSGKGGSTDKGGSDPSSSSSMTDLETQDDTIRQKSMRRALKLMERVVSQNGDSQKYLKFRYFEYSDPVKSANKISLTKLWTFRVNKQKSHLHGLKNKDNGGSGGGGGASGSSGSGIGSSTGPSGSDSRAMNLGLERRQISSVTCLCWNRRYNDLFAVGYGSFDFHKQSSGRVALFSLKCTHFPALIIECESGVMCLDFDDKYPSLLCVGLYDGSVAVYDVRHKHGMPIYSSERPESFHMDPVWQIQWKRDSYGLFGGGGSAGTSGAKSGEDGEDGDGEDDEKKGDDPSGRETADDAVRMVGGGGGPGSSENLSFYSIGSDGFLKKWIMRQNELECHSLIEMGPQCLCSSFDFNPFNGHLTESNILIGTENGQIFLHEDGDTLIIDGSGEGKAKMDEPVDDILSGGQGHGHAMNVYGVKWNPFDPTTFISCSEDWHIKLWSNLNHIIAYDLNSPVNDIAWAPFSATVFGGVTQDGRVHIFDLNQNKNGPMYSQKIMTGSMNGVALTRIEFAPSDPLIIVGDESGQVMSFKLSRKLFETKSNLSVPRYADLSRDSEKRRLSKILKVTGSNVFKLTQVSSVSSIS